MAEKENKLPRLISRKELAEYFGTSPEAIQVQHSSGRLDLPFIKRGRLAYYLESDVLAWLERHRVEPGGPER